MKPALSPTMTGFLPSRSASALTSSKISSLVMTVLMTSTNWSTGAGLKKCMPTTRLGLIVATAISVTGSELVLVARIASSETIASSLAKMSFLRSRCSGTASTTSWHSLRSAMSLVNCTRAWSAAWSSALSLPRVTARSVECCRTPLPFSTASSVTSTATTSMPLRAKTSTMPAPMVPSPMTPTLVNSRAMGGVSQRVCAAHTRPGRDAAHAQPPLGWTGASRHSPVQRRLRRSPHRPPPARDPAARRQGRRLGARPQRRRLLQAAQLDVAALHDGRGRARRGARPAEGVVAVWRVQHAKSEDRLTVLHPRGPARLGPRARGRPRPRQGRRRGPPAAAARRAHPHRSATAGRSCAAST